MLRSVRRNDRSSITTLLLLALALLLAGCGGGDGGEPLSKDAYADRLETVATKLAENEAVTGEGEPTTANFREGAAAMQEASAELADIEPPADVAQLHDDYVAGLDDFGSALAALAPRLDDLKADPKANSADLVKLRTDLDGASKRLGTAIEGLEAEGYTVG
ncbi:MAG: hypothetical protein JWO69_860 [Thermoleophilia bacterium]|nr:hypothetical protein [Thermoleophilia bacterium]